MFERFRERVGIAPVVCAVMALATACIFAAMVGPTTMPRDIFGDQYGAAAFCTSIAFSAIMMRIVKDWIETSVERIMSVAIFVIAQAFALGSIALITGHTAIGALFIALSVIDAAILARCLHRRRPLEQEKGSET